MRIKFLSKKFGKVGVSFIIFSRHNCLYRFTIHFVLITTYFGLVGHPHVPGVCISFFRFN
jgi:hypothetical protein